MSILARFKWPILLAVVGAVMMVPVVTSFLTLFRDSGTPFVGPGEMTVNIAKSGDYTLWHESRTMINGQFMSFPDDLPTGTTIKVLKHPEGTPITLNRGMSTHMEKSGTRRVAVGQLTFSTPGQYRVIVTDLPEKRAFYLDESKFLQMFATIMICGFVGMLFFLAAFILAILALVQIINARRNPPPPVQPH